MDFEPWNSVYGSMFPCMGFDCGSHGAWQVTGKPSGERKPRMGKERRRGKHELEGGVPCPILTNDSVGPKKEELQ